MSDRHWMEKWKLNLATGMLERKVDRVRAASWTEAADIEAFEKGITRSQMLTDPRYEMVPLSETVRPPERVETPDYEAALEAIMAMDEGLIAPANPNRPEVLEQLRAMREAVDRMEARPIPWAVQPGGKTESRGMLWMGWIFFVAAVFLAIKQPDFLPTALIGTLFFFGGVAIGGYLVKN